MIIPSRAGASTVPAKLHPNKPKDCPARALTNALSVSIIYMSILTYKMLSGYREILEAEMKLLRVARVVNLVLAGMLTGNADPDLDE